MAINILMFEVKDAEKNFFNTHSFKGMNITFFKEALNEDFIENLSAELFENTHVISIGNDSLVRDQIMNKFRNLRILSVRGTDFDHICLKTCEEKNIALINLSKTGAKSSAQFIIGLMITLVRKIVPANKMIRMPEESNIDFVGRDLSTMTLGVIGANEIGEEVCKIASSLGMKVLICDIYKKNIPEEKYNAQYLSLEELIKTSDIISLNMPYMTEAYHLFNEKIFSQCKDGVFFISTSRAELINFDVFYKYLEQKKIKGAALDISTCNYICEKCKSLSEKLENTSLECLEQTKYLENFTKYQNVIITPNISDLTEETINAVLYETMVNIQETINGERSCRVV